MVKITNGVEVFEVPSGAFKNFYKKQGFTEIKERKQTPQQTAQVVADEAEEYTKPLGQWTKEEVKAFASENGIDISNTKNVAEAKQRIKAFLDSQD